MNLEHQRQHEAHKARLARMGRPACKGIIAPVVRSAIEGARVEERRAAAEVRLVELDRQHRFRLDCIREAYDGERTMARTLLSELLSDALLDITAREAADLVGEREFYLMELRSGALA